MKKEALIQKAYEIAVERYAAVGVDSEQTRQCLPAARGRRARPEIPPG